MADRTDLRHPWNLSSQAAVALQRQLRTHVSLAPLPGPIRTIGGADISYNRFSDVVYAGIVVLDYASQRPLLRSTVVGQLTFPYVPGLLSFREIPSLIEAWDQLPEPPDVVMVDGHGIAHPRRMGIATHFGLVTGCPSLGCGKKVLVGKFDEPAPQRGSASPMVHQGEVVGHALRTKDRVTPVYIAPGTGMSLEDAVRIGLHCARGYRLPEPTRQAHLTVNALRTGEIAPGVERLSWSPPA